MKLEVGMYVRTKDEIIAKIDYIDDATIFFDKDLYRVYGDSINFLEKDNLEKIAKASYNIIDILEVGDYVNGKKIVEKFDNWLDLGNDTVENNDIKSIITHEQMEQMTYKVGE